MNRYYVRKGFEHRGPHTKAEHIDAWMAASIYACRFKAIDAFNEEVAYGDIYEVAAPVAHGDWTPAQGQGCICPPTSERTCQSATCPRRPTTWDVVTPLQLDRLYRQINSVSPWTT